MRALALLSVLTAVAVVSAASIATVDFYGLNARAGANQTLNLLAPTVPGSAQVATGVTAAAYTTGPDLTSVGTAASNSLWATGWTGQAGDYFRLSVTLDPMYEGTLDELRYGTRASGTGPLANMVTIAVNGAQVYSHNFTDTGTSTFNNEWLTGLGIALPAGASIEVTWKNNLPNPSGSATGTWRLATYYSGAYYGTGILGTLTEVPEPASLVLLALGMFFRRR